MTIDEQTLSELETQCLANKESELAQVIPAAPRAFLRVESLVQAAQLKSLEKRAVEGQKQALAATAKWEGLRAIARDFDGDYTPAVKFRFTGKATAEAAASVASGAELTSDSTGAYYTVITGGSESGGYVEFTVEANSAGEDANLDISETFSFTSEISGVGVAVSIEEILVYGEDQETLEAFRARVLALQRKTTGGGNLSDYKDWAEAVSGVERAFVYAGKPITWQTNDIYFSFDAATRRITDNNPRHIHALGIGAFGLDEFGTIGIGDMIEVSGSTSNDGFFTVVGIVSTFVLQVEEALTDEAYGDDITIQNASQPGDRTVFIQSTDESAYGIPTEELLELVRDGINTDSAGNMQPGLGDPNSTLYVEPISRVTFDVTIYNLSVDSSQEDDCKSRIEEDLDTYFGNLRPFMEGLDFEFDRNDMATITSVSEVVQNVLRAYGATADTLALEVDGEAVTSYQLGQGELGKYSETYWEVIE